MSYFNNVRELATAYLRAKVSLEGEFSTDFAQSAQDMFKMQENVNELLASLGEEPVKFKLFFGYDAMEVDNDE